MKIGDSQKADEASKPTYAIELQNVTAGYGNRVILDDVSIQIRQGQIYTVIGLSGSGKSTLVKLVIGFLKPMKGRILIDGEDITEYSERQLRQVRLKMGMLFQRAALFNSLNVFENVAFPLKYRAKVKKSLIPSIVASKLADVDMLGTELYMPDELSGGMQKRVGLARALAENPTIILYDEPTTGLDPVITNNINRLIVRTRDKYNATSLVISHDMESVFKISDQVAVLVKGKIAAVGTPDEIKSSSIPEVRAFIHGEEIPSLDHLPHRPRSC